MGALLSRTNYVRLTGNVPSPSGGATVSAWVRRRTSVTGETAIIDLCDSDGSERHLISSGAAQTTVNCWNVHNWDYAYNKAWTVTLDVWTYVALVWDGTTQNAYSMLEGAGALTSDTHGCGAWSGTPLSLGVGCLGNGSLNPVADSWDYAFVRYWTAALTSSELYSEATSATAVRSSNLALNVRFQSDFSCTVHGSGDFTNGGSFQASTAPAEPTLTSSYTLKAYGHMMTGAFGGTSEGQGYASDWLSHDIKVALHNASWSPSQDNDETWSNTNEVSGGSYQTGGLSLSGKTVSYASKATTLSASPVTFDDSHSARYAVIYNNTATGKPLLGYIDFGSAQATGSQFEVDWDAAGIFKIEVA